MYKLSRLELSVAGSDFVHDYNKCFVWISLSTFGPYLIQYASQINLLYQKGAFQDQNLERIGILKRLYLILHMTVIGLIFVPAIDFMIKFQTVINILFLPFGCCKKRGKPLNERVRDSMSLQIMRATDMNEFEIDSFKQ